MTHSSIRQITNSAVGRQLALRQAEVNYLQQKRRIARAKAIANLHGFDPRSLVDRQPQERALNQ
jgi:hypothetical protein